MSPTGIRRWSMVVLVVGFAGGVMVWGAGAQTPSAQGNWRSGDTTLRVVVNKSEVKGTFVELGQDARALGFKPGEQSFVATMMDNYLHGETTFRYGGSCHPKGRRIAMIGRLTPDGQALAIHYYNIAIDQSCRDTGQYTIGQSLYQRAAGR